MQPVYFADDGPGPHPLGRLAADITVVAAENVRNLREEAKRGIAERLEQGRPLYPRRARCRRTRSDVRALRGTRPVVYTACWKTKGDQQPMGLLCAVEETMDSGGHEYRVLGPDTSDDWLKELAEEYVHLRTACVRPLSEISVDGIGILSTEKLLDRLRKATIPVRRADNFDVVRSDFGEVLSYLLLERHYGVKLGYKSVRDREITQSPGRGIDALGIEDGDKITLVLGETKVSDDKTSPPSVVDKSDDCLSRQHVGHLSELDQTAKKLWDTARRVTDLDLRQMYMTAAILLENRHLDRIKLIGCCTLVRSRQRYTIADFGSFKNNPKKYEPAQIRFLVIRLADSIEDVVKRWYRIVQEVEVAA